MHLNSRTVCLVTGLLLPGVVSGDQRRTSYSTTIESPNRKHLVRLKPYPEWPAKRKGPIKRGECHAALYRIEGGKEVKVWERFLININAPARVMVTDSGRYVITMNELHARHMNPVIIYGADGTLIKAHDRMSIRWVDLISGPKRKYVNDGWDAFAFWAFTSDEETFVIRPQGRDILMLFRLKDGAFYSEDAPQRKEATSMPAEEWEALLAEAHEQVRKAAIAFLASDDPDDRAAGAMACGELQLSEAIPALRTLLTDESMREVRVGAYSDPLRAGERFTYHHVRSAARQALKEMGITVPTSSTQPAATAPASE